VYMFRELHTERHQETTSTYQPFPQVSPSVASHQSEHNSLKIAYILTVGSKESLHRHTFLLGT